MDRPSWIGLIYNVAAQRWAVPKCTILLYIVVMDDPHWDLS